MRWLSLLLVLAVAGCGPGDVTENGQLDKQKEIADATKKAGGKTTHARE